MIWIEQDSRVPDTHAAMRGAFELSHPADVELRILGASWFAAWLDGEFLTEGPTRFAVKFPEYTASRVHLPAGKHVLAAQVHDDGTWTNLLPDVRPFFSCQILLDGKSIPVAWKSIPLEGFRAGTRRLSPILGWIEWCDTRKNPEGWQRINFDDSQWKEPLAAAPQIGEVLPPSIGHVQQISHSLTPIAGGPLAETFGYELDDISTRFFLRDLKCEKLPPKGLWRRYDLGRVRLGKARILLDLPAGAVVELAYSEALIHERVSPYISLSLGPTCNLDHYVARGGEQEFGPITPRGGRFIEVHVLASPDQIRFVREQFIERTYHDKPQGAFQCEDELLNRIWMTGVETFRACSEDAVTDTPTRERGEWTGDVVSVGMQIAAAVFSDLRLLRRGLVQAAHTAREDGFIAALSPGNPLFLSTYAVQWIVACRDYLRATGDQSLLEEMLPYALRNMEVFEQRVSSEGLASEGLGWMYIDWGYKAPEAPVDLALNVHYLAALEAMAQWCERLGHSRAGHFRKLHGQLSEIIRAIFDRVKAKSGFRGLGYHASALGLGLGLFDGPEQRGCIDFIKQHILGSFPNNRDAPRNSDPSVSSEQIITPYFAHFAFPPLIERGEMDFVLDQYRKCWGWALEDARTTWVEVFDTRWTHCHQWAGCPTWQLTRYGLGLHSRFDLGKNHYALNLQPGSLAQAQGKLPITGTQLQIDIGWKRQNNEIQYKIQTPMPITLHDGQKILEIATTFETTIRE